MSAARYSVTYEIVTERSAREGDADERGFIIEETGDLQEAIRALHSTRTSKVDSGQGAHAEFDGDRPVAVFVLNGAEFETCAHETRTLHIPREVSTGTARRIAELAGAKVTKR
jgi:hypothetical protein